MTIRRERVYGVLVHRDHVVGQFSIAYEAVRDGMFDLQYLYVGDQVPLTVDGVAVDRFELVRWVATTRDPRVELEIDPERYDTVVAANFLSEPPTP